MRVAWLLVVMLLAGCVSARPQGVPATDAALRSALNRHISVLASDEYGGRQPGTEGEAKTLRYLVREWQAAGLVSGTNDPANPWFAPVELTSSTPERSTVSFARNGRSVLLPDDEAVIFSSGRRGLVERAPVLFVGEQGEQLETAALAGRVVLMLWDHAGQAEQREALLRGGANTQLCVNILEELFDVLHVLRLVIVLAAHLDESPIFAGRYHSRKCAAVVCAEQHRHSRIVRTGKHECRTRCQHRTNGLINHR